MKNLNNNWPKILFLILLGLIILINLPPLAGEIQRISKNRKIVDHNLIGYKFFGLNEYIGDEAYVGYYTNEDIREQKPQKLFTHAQYILAPTILDFGNLNRKYIIFACSSREEALRKIFEMDLQPLIANQYNIILAKRKDL